VLFPKRIKTLQFFCPFGALKNGKQQQAPEQSEGGKSQESTGDWARSDRVRHTAAKDD